MPGSKSINRFASETKVDPADTRKEIEQLLSRYHAEGFGWVVEQDFGSLYFRIEGQAYRLNVKYPSLSDREVERTPTGIYRYSDEAKVAAREKIIRQRWRQLRLYVHATLEAVASGMITLDQALFAHLLLPNGQRMYDATRDRLEQVAREGLSPRLLEPPKGEGW